MKKISFITLCLLAIFFLRFANAQSVSLSMAEEAAQKWLQVHKHHKSGSFHQITDKKGSLMAYCFDLVPEGYIIISSNQHLPPVLAYSFTNNYINNPGQQNPLEDILIRDIGSRMEWMERSVSTSKAKNFQQWQSLLGGSKTSSVFEQWPPAGSTSTGGWLETNWKQSSPYNKFCPMDEVTGLRSVAGCPAVALAMIIHYQKNLNGTQFTDDDDYYHNYAGRQYWIDDDHLAIDFPSFPRLNEYFDSMALKFPVYIPLSEDEIAALVFACGVAARQVYTSAVSGTFGVNQAYDAYQRFAYQDAILIYDSDTSFYTHMKNNMKN
ncbi:MAG: C10 family peptidase, partial [Bacteroidales bacterium]|nr:C10 family peptidase [Bacteroidales bacterium]